MTTHQEKLITNIEQQVTFFEKFKDSLALKVFMEPFSTAASCLSAFEHLCCILNTLPDHVKTLPTEVVNDDLFLKLKVLQEDLYNLNNIKSFLYDDDFLRKLYQENTGTSLSNKAYKNIYMKKCLSIRSQLEHIFLNNYVFLDKAISFLRKEKPLKETTMKKLL